MKFRKGRLSRQPMAKYASGVAQLRRSEQWPLLVEGDARVSTPSLLVDIMYAFPCDTIQKMN